MTFEGTIRAGDLITFVGFLVVGLGAYFSIKETLKLFGYRLDIIDASIEDLKVDFGNGKVQDAEIERLKKDMERHSQQIFELQRGKGYVLADRRNE